MAKTKFFRKIQPKMADFLCILVWNLDWPALNQFYSDLPQIFCGRLLCISTCNPSLGIKFWHTLVHRPFMWRAWGNTPWYLCFWSQHNIADHLRPFWSKLEIFFEKKYFFIQGFSAKKNQYFVRGGVIFEKKSEVRYPHVSGRAWNPTIWNYKPALY